MDATELFPLLRSGRPPAGIRVRSSLSLAGTRMRRLPADLAVHGDLDLRQCERLRHLGDGLCVERDLRIGGSLRPGQLSRAERAREASRRRAAGSGDGEAPAAARVLGAGKDRHTPLATLPENLFVGGSLWLVSCPYVRSFPARFSIGGSIFLSGCTSLAELPRGLRVAGDLTILGGPSLTALPEGLHVAGNLRIEGTQIAALPPDLHVGGDITLAGCRRLGSLGGLTVNGDLDVRGFRGEELPEGLRVPGSLRLSRPHALTRTPAGLRAGRDIEVRRAPKLAEVSAGIQVGEDLVLRGCEALTRLPAGLNVLGRLDLAGCTSLTALPPGLRAGTLNLADCAALSVLPDDLKVAVAVEVAGTSLRDWPMAMPGSLLRWRGVQIPPDAVLRPETLTPERILTERNAELRRLMLERAGLDRVLTRANRVLIDSDRDPGGERQLVEVSLPTWRGQGRPELTRFLACRCPSTGRHYLLRVPPTVTSCHAAAAWLAGFDDPARYRPVKET